MDGVLACRQTWTFMSLTFDLWGSGGVGGGASQRQSLTDKTCSERKENWEEEGARGVEGGGRRVIGSRCAR